MKLIDLNFHVHREFGSLNDAVASHKEALGYVDHIKDQVEIQVIKHIGREETAVINDVKYLSFNSSAGFFSIPFKTLSYVRKQKPDVVLVQGLIFPVQLIFLHFSLERSCLLIAQNHAEGPFRIKRILQQLADRYIDAYLFTAFGNAKAWLDAGVIGRSEKIFELQEGSTSFKKQDKTFCQNRLRITGDNNFLFVGSLDKNKDPLTVLSGFEQFLAFDDTARLYLVYQSGELLEDVKKKIAGSSLLKTAVLMVGKVEHKELEYWYNAVDFYISASHSESTGYALLESMACGCIPVISDIPSYRKIIGDGKYGSLFSAGDAHSLYNALIKLKREDRVELSRSVTDHFNKNCSFRAIADGLYSIYKTLQAI